MKSIMQFTIIVLLLFSSCRKDSIIDNVSIFIPNGNKIESTFRVDIIDELGQPVSDALVLINTNQEISDKYGVSIFKNTQISEDGELLKISKAGYFTTYKRIIPNIGEESYSKIRLVKKQKESGNIQSTKGGKMKGENGVVINFSPNTFIDESNGNEYSGNVKIYTHLFDPTDVFMFESMPGNLEGITKDGSLKQLRSFGMVLIELEGESGQKLNLKNGATANISIPIPEKLLKHSEDKIKLWYLDEHSALWIEKGIAIKVENNYMFDVSHFSTWNCDQINQTIELNGRLISNSNNPIAYSKITISSLDNLIYNYTYTSKSGNFKIKVPKNEELILSVYNACSEVVLVKNIGSSENNMDLGDIIVPKDETIEIEGSLVDCFGKKIIDGYLIVEYENGRSISIQIDTSGKFKLNILKCLDHNISVKGIDLLNLNTSEAFTFDISNLSILSLPQIIICEKLEEYIIIKYKDESFTFFKPIASLYPNSVNIGTLTLDRFISIETKKIDDNNYKVIDIIYSNRFEFFINSNIADLTELKVNFTKTGGLNEFVEGSITGKIRKDNELIDLEIEFRSKIKSVMETISGRVWLDENRNGIQDIDEKGIEGIKINGYPNTSLTDENGNYTIYVNSDQLNELKITTTNKYTLSPLNKGSDNTKDSDFDPITKKTTSLYVKTGNPVKNVDAGLTENSITIQLLVYSKCDRSAGCAEISIDDGNAGKKYDYTIEDTNFNKTGSGKITDNNIVICDFDFEEIYIMKILLDGLILWEDNVYVPTPTFEDMTLSFVPETFNCSPPTGDLNVEVSGGVKPFKYKWSSTSGFVNSNRLSSVSANLYSVTVVDKIGCIQSIEEFIDFKTQFIQGSVWLENSSNVNDKRDNDDTYVENVNIILKDKDHNIIYSQKTNSKGQYRFENIIDGEYYIEIEVPIDHSLVKKHAATDWQVDSDADPSTNKTDLFLVENACFLEYFIDFGLKKN